MKNLAGAPQAETDGHASAELATAGIEIVTVEPSPGEIHTSVTGRLGAFTFERRWYYWAVSGPMPVDAARELNEKWGKVVRVCGYGGGVSDVEPWVTWSLDGVEVIGDPSGKQAAEWGKYIAKYPALACPPILFATDPSKIPGCKAHITSYHVDTQEGLCALAAVIRGLPPR